MKIALGIIAALFACLLIVGIICGIYFVSTMNNEQGLRNLVEAKQLDNNNEFDNMKKKINQIVQLSDAQMQAVTDIIMGYTKERAQQGKGSLAAMVHEAIPNVDVKVFDNIMNEIISSRNAWTMRQKELIDINRQHTNAVTLFPSSLVCSILGRKEMKITIVTSADTKEAFRTGEDNNTDLGIKKRTVEK